KQRAWRMRISYFVTWVTERKKGLKHVVHISEVDLRTLTLDVRIAWCIASGLLTREVGTSLPAEDAQAVRTLHQMGFIGDDVEVAWARVDAFLKPAATPPAAAAAAAVVEVEDEDRPASLAPAIVGAPTAAKSDKKKDSGRKKEPKKEAKKEAKEGKE